MPSVTLTNARGSSLTASSLPELEHLLRRGYLPTSGTATDARAQFQPAVATERQAQENYVSAVSAAPRRGAAGSSNHCSGDGSTSTTAGTFRTPHRIAVDCTDLRLVFQNFAPVMASHVDTDGTATLTVPASLEVGGVIYRVTFGGAAAATVAPGGWAISDPLGVEVSAGDIVYSRVFHDGTVRYRNRNTGAASGNGGFVATTDLTAPGSAAIADSFTPGYAPAALLGTPTKATPVVAGVGDSIMDGVGDGTQPTLAMSGNTPTGQRGGFVARALSGVLPHVNLALSGDTAQAFAATAGHVRRAAALGVVGVTHAVDDFGTNDLTAGRSLAQIQADKLTIWRLLARRGIKVYATSLLPRTSSTDNFGSLGGQTVTAYEATRVGVNDWLRAGAPIVNGAAVAVGTAGALLAGQAGHPLTGYFETADRVESARNSGKWAMQATTRVVTDGITTTSKNLTSATANFTQADVGRAVMVTGAGTSGALHSTTIESVTSSTVAVMVNFSPTAVPSGATVTIGALTWDGIHPTMDGHALAAGAIAPGSFTA